MAPVAVLVRLQLEPGREDQFEAEMASILQQVRQEPACISINGHRDPNNQSAFMLFELWESAEAFAEFEQGRQYMHDYMAKVMPWWTGERDLTIWEQVA